MTKVVELMEIMWALSIIGSHLCDDGVLCVQLGSMEKSFDELVNDLVIGSEVSIVAWNRLSLNKKMGF